MKQIIKVMTWHEIQESKYIASAQAIQDLTVSDFLDVFDIVDEFNGCAGKLQIEICTEDVKVTLDITKPGEYYE